MNINEIEQFIKTKVTNGEYQIKLHALQRINERGILGNDIKEALLNCKVIEDYPHDKRGHSCLVCGKIDNEKNLHIVCGLTKDTVWIVTIYEPDPKEWETPQKRRKNK